MISEPGLMLASGLCALAGVLLALDSHARIAAAVAAIPMVALWQCLRQQARQVTELRQQLSSSKEEVFTRRSTMRFIFDELLHDPDILPPQVRQMQQQMDQSLAAAGGLAELLGQSLDDPPHSVRQIYLRELGQALQKCTLLNRQLLSGDPPVAVVKTRRRDEDRKTAGRIRESLSG